MRESEDAPFEEKLAFIEAHPESKSAFLYMLSEEIAAIVFPAYASAYQHLMDHATNGAELSDDDLRTITGSDQFAQMLMGLGSYQAIKSYCDEHSYHLPDAAKVGMLIEDALEIGANQTKVQ